MKHSAVEVGNAWLKHGGNPAKVFEAVAITWAESKWDDSASSWCCHGVWALHQEHTDPACARNLDCATKRAIELSNNGRDWSPWDVHPASQGRTHFASDSPAIRNYEQGLRIARRNRGLQKMVDLKTPLFDVPLPGPDLDLSNPLLGPMLGPKLLEKGAGAIGDLGIPGVSDVAGGISNIAAFFRGLGELILTPEGWLRLAKLIGGAIMFMWGLRVFIRMSTGTDPVKAAKSTAAKAAEAAAVVATVK